MLPVHVVLELDVHHIWIIFQLPIAAHVKTFNLCQRRLAGLVVFVLLQQLDLLELAGNPCMWSWVQTCATQPLSRSHIMAGIALSTTDAVSAGTW